MNKHNRLLLAMLSLITIQANAVISDFRTPTPLDRAYAYSHYPFTRPEYSDCKSVYVDFWAAGLYRTANSAFIDKNSFRTEDISGLFFGATDFTALQAFAPGSESPFNPLVGLLLLSPRFDYTERTAFFGSNIETVLGCDCNWHLGARFRVPFRSVKLELDSCCDLIEDANNLCLRDNERLTCPDCEPPSDPLVQPVDDVFACRLDLYSALFQTQSGIPPHERFVQYGNGVNIPPAEGNTEINQKDVTSANNSPIYLIRSVGVQPIAPFGLTQPNVDALPILAADGSTASNARFGTGIDYAAGIGSNPAAQRNFWVAPQINTDSDGDLDVHTDAANIRDRADALLRLGSQSVLELLATNSVNFNTQRRNGIGDLDFELYGRYDGCLCSGCWFGEGIFGVRFPTGSRVKTPGDLLLVATGNNRHYEVKLGGLLGWTPIDWFAVKADAFYYWVLRRTERVNAPFAGATVKNIGPALDAHVKWQYFVGDIDFTFLIPCITPLVGFNIGYQAWVKQKTHVDFDVTSAVDFFGVTQLLDASVLENRTKRISHTVKTEIFKQTCNFQLFAGWNHTFAGKNSLKDSDWYLGLEVYF